jgi:hypothetical protein
MSASNQRMMESRVRLTAGRTRSVPCSRQGRRVNQDDSDRKNVPFEVVEARALNGSVSAGSNA